MALTGSALACLPVDSDRRVELLVRRPVDLREAEEQLDRLEELVASLLQRNLQLQQALDSRVVIEQAKGVLAERYRIGMDEAFDLLRRSSRNQRKRIHALAGAVVSSHETPAEIPPPRAA
jgi:AmiR/NasT family two-component response regulator